MEPLISTGDFLNVRHTGVSHFIVPGCCIGPLRAKKKKEGPTAYTIRTPRKTEPLHKMFGILLLFSF